MAALAAKLCGSEGTYRGPSGNAYIFITFRDIKINKQPATPQIAPSFPYEIARQPRHPPSFSWMKAQVMLWN